MFNSFLLIFWFSSISLFSFFIFLVFTGSVVACRYTNNSYNSESCNYKKPQSWCNIYRKKDVAVTNKRHKGGGQGVCVQVQFQFFFILREIMLKAFISSPTENVVFSQFLFFLFSFRSFHRLALVTSNILYLGFTCVR